MLFDTDTLSFALTYGGTLVVALLMFIGQLTAAVVLLVCTGVIWLTAYLFQAVTRSFRTTNQR
ncbi:hypothetical protein M1D93_20020 (plasmid) [Arthrobacter sp. Z1-9]